MNEKSNVFPNKTKQALKRGEIVVGTMSSVLGWAEVPRICAVAGMDFVMADTEHSPYDIPKLREIISHARLCGVTSLVRVPDCEYHLMARVLDVGAQGLMIPRVETMEQVNRIVASTKYPPVGRRGCGGIDLQHDLEPIAIKDWLTLANEETMNIIQIESQEALDIINDLVSVEGVDVALIGPADLSISLGIPGEFKNPRFIDAVSRVVEAAEKAGIASGIHLPDPELVDFWAERGMRFLMCNTDMSLLIAGIKDLGATLNEIRARHA